MPIKTVHVPKICLNVQLFHTVQLAATWLILPIELTNERPGNWSCDLRANWALGGDNIQHSTFNIQHTDIATIWLTWPRGLSRWKFRSLALTVWECKCFEEFFRTKSVTYWMNHYTLKLNISTIRLIICN